jgi:hypothetical protein
MGYNPNEPRNYHGEWTAGGSTLSAKAIKAKASYKKANKDEQRYAENQEAELVKKIGGKQSSDSAVFDVTRKRGDIIDGIEVKTKVNGIEHEIYMKPSAKKRKREWAIEEKNRVIHTVVFDHRDRFNKGEFKKLYSGHELYYRRGVGKMQLSAMYKVKSYRELEQLMRMPYEDLPAKAQGK